MNTIRVGGSTVRVNTEHHQSRSGATVNTMRVGESSVTLNAIRVGESRNSLNTIRVGVGAGSL